MTRFWSCIVKCDVPNCESEQKTIGQIPTNWKIFKRAHLPDGENDLCVDVERHVCPKCGPSATEDSNPFEGYGWKECENIMNAQLKRKDHGTE